MPGPSPADSAHDRPSFNQNRQHQILGILLRICLDLHLLPVLQVPISLRTLCTKVDQVAAEEERVHWRHGEGVAHEGGGVDDEGTGHLAGDAIQKVSLANALKLCKMGS